MKLNPPFFKLCRSKGLSVSKKLLSHRAEDYYNWSVSKGATAYYTMNDTGTGAVDSLGNYPTASIGANILKSQNGFDDVSDAMQGPFRQPGLVQDYSQAPQDFIVSPDTGSKWTNFPNPFTVELLFKSPSRAWQVGSTTALYSLFNQGFATIGRVNIAIFKFSTNPLVLRASVTCDKPGGGGPPSTYLISLDLTNYAWNDKWTQVALTAWTTGATPIVQMVVNGKEVGAHTHPSTGTALVATTGAASFGGGSETYNGCSGAVVDEIVLYPSVLTVEELNAHWLLTGLESWY